MDSGQAVNNHGGDRRFRTHGLLHDRQGALVEGLCFGVIILGLVEQSQAIEAGSQPGVLWSKLFRLSDGRSQKVLGFRKPSLLVSLIAGPGLRLPACFVLAAMGRCGN